MYITDMHNTMHMSTIAGYDEVAGLLVPLGHELVGLLVMVSQVFTQRISPCGPSPPPSPWPATGPPCPYSSSPPNPCRFVNIECRGPPSAPAEIPQHS